MLTIDDCRLAYPDFAARYTLSVADRSLCAVVGPSGGGKTTLLHMIAGFETPYAGRLDFDGRDLLRLRPAKRPVALVFQDHNLFPHLSAAQNIALGIKPSLQLSDEEQARLAEAVAAAGLEGLEDRRPGEMSGGQRQRVALARALVSRRPLILLDEPFGALDPGLRRSMIAHVDGLRRRWKITIVMTIHTPDEVMGVAETMAFVADGEVIAAGAPREVLDPGRDSRIAAFLGTSPLPSGRKRVD
jgi:thiamine transport system ATP-binding protein